MALITLTVLSSSGAQVCQKLAAKSSGVNGSLITNRHFVASLALLGVSLGSWLMVLERMDVSVAYPLLSLNYLVVLLIARFYFGEPVPTYRWLGTLVILVGIVLLLSSESP